MEALEAIHKRCSLKTHLSGQTIEPEKINIILEAARQAASARNMQPWRFVVVQGKEAVEALAQAFPGPNLVIKQAPVVIIACARPSDDVAHDGKDYYLFDVGMAVGNMLLAATDLGLVTHPMSGFNETEIKRILQIPEDVRVVVATPLAYPLEASYDEAAQERLNRRTRKELQEAVYFDKWNELEPA